MPLWFVLNVLFNKCHSTPSACSDVLKVLVEGIEGLEFERTLVCQISGSWNADVPKCKGNSLVFLLFVCFFEIAKLSC